MGDMPGRIGVFIALFTVQVIVGASHVILTPRLNYRDEHLLYNMIVFILIGFMQVGFAMMIDRWIQRKRPNTPFCTYDVIMQLAMGTCPVGECLVILVGQMVGMAWMLRALHQYSLLSDIMAFPRNINPYVAIHAHMVTVLACQQVQQSSSLQQQQQRRIEYAGIFCNAGTLVFFAFGLSSGENGVKCGMLGMYDPRYAIVGGGLASIVVGVLTGIAMASIFVSIYRYLQRLDQPTEWAIKEEECFYFVVVVTGRDLRDGTFIMTVSNDSRAMSFCHP